MKNHADTSMGAWLTHFIYWRRKKTNVPLPRIEEYIAMLVNRLLPGHWQKGNAVIRVVRISFFCLLLLRLVAYPLKILTYSCIGILRLVLKMCLKIIQYVAYAVRCNKRFSFLSDNSVELDNGVWFTGYTLRSHTLDLRFVATLPLKTDLMLFLHLYPLEEPELDALIEGRISMDHWPSVRTHLWRVGQVVSDTTALDSLRQGYYRVGLGLYNPYTFERVGVIGNDEDEVSLGWIKLGGPNV